MMSVRMAVVDDGFLSCKLLLGTGHFFIGCGVLVGFERGPRKKRLNDICSTANSQPECRKPAFLTFGKFRFSRESMLLDPLLNR